MTNLINSPSGWVKGDNLRSNPCRLKVDDTLGIGNGTSDSAIVCSSFYIQNVSSPDRDSAMVINVGPDLSLGVLSATKRDLAALASCILDW